MVEEWRGNTPWAVWGSSTVATLTSLSPLFLPINTKGESITKGRSRENRTREEKKEGKNKEQKKEGEKERKKQKKKNRGGRGRRRRSKAGHCSPPPQRQHPHRQHYKQLVDVRLVALTVTFVLRSPSIVHVACEQWRVIHCFFFLMHLGQVCPSPLN